MKSRIILSGILILACFTFLFAESDIPQRSDIEVQYQWNLQDIFPSVDAWENDFKTVESGLSEFSEFKGKLKKSGTAILKCLELDSKLSLKLDNLYVYAGLLKDEDTRISENQALNDRARGLYVKYGEATSFILPELQTIPEKKLYKFIVKTPGLEVYRFFFDNLIRQREHTLSSEEEELLAMAGDLFRGPRKIHEALTTTDMVFPMVKDEDGSEIRLTRGRYSKLLLSRDSEIRRGAFLGRTEAFDKVKNTNAAVFDTYLKKDLFISRARKYNSTLEMSLDADNVPVGVFNNLLNTAYDNVDALNRYMELRRKVMGLDEIHLYDTAVPIVEDVSLDVAYDNAVTTLIKAFEPMGEEYVEMVKKGFSSRWVDVYETEAKRGGAYSWGTYSSHPYMLMNYNGTQRDMFTLAHEMGHAMHSYYSNANQPYPTSGYTLFVAEVASTFNEALLMDYLLKNTDDPKLKLALLDRWVNNFLGTVFTQIIFSEFERNAHQMASEGKPVTVESLNQTYFDVEDKWYGDVAVIDDGYKLNWGRIPHFYRRFYVYKYAISYCASAALSKAVLEGREGALENYMNFLKSGGNDYPIEQLKAAGVDLSSPQPIDDAMVLFNDLVAQMEELLLD
ncbi:MAG: oligoendopeptidase F [Candidatus Marinimicrobia bacterium]|nr:oligoendopeptidase F [Candidatus Neomarinimicrobiota bacterium]